MGSLPLLKVSPRTAPVLCIQCYVSLHYLVDLTCAPAPGLMGQAHSHHPPGQHSHFHFILQWNTLLSFGADWGNDGCVAGELGWAWRDPDSVSGFWACVSDALLMFPLTQPLRLGLLDLLCGSSASPHQVMIWTLAVVFSPDKSKLQLYFTASVTRNRFSIKGSNEVSPMGGFQRLLL